MGLAVYRSAGTPGLGRAPWAGSSTRGEILETADRSRAGVPCRSTGNRPNPDHRTLSSPGFVQGSKRHACTPAVLSNHGRTHGFRGRAWPNGMLDPSGLRGPDSLRKSRSQSKKHGFFEVRLKDHKKSVANRAVYTDPCSPLEKTKTEREFCLLFLV